MASQESNKYPNDWKHHIMDIFTSWKKFSINK
jgi:hypothetical protein